MKKINWLITDNNITVNYEGKTHIVSRGDALAEKLIAALKNGEEDKIPELVDTAKRVAKFSNGEFEVRDGEVFVNGVKVPSQLGRKIKQFVDEGLPYKPLVKFAEKLLQNPSFRAVNELFGFLEANDQAITSDGKFIAYKRVRSDFKDIHSGTFDNSPGTTVSVPRNMVDEDANRTCSKGLHLAAWIYSHTQFASSNPATDIMLECECSPADVVAVPIDYNNAKMRVCEYKVLGVVDKELSKEIKIRYTDPVSSVESFDEESSEEDWVEDEESSEEFEEEESSADTEEIDEDSSEEEYVW